jgi:hypothetical protein
MLEGRPYQARKEKQLTDQEALAIRKIAVGSFSPTQGVLFHALFPHSFCFHRRETIQGQYRKVPAKQHRPSVEAFSSSVLAFSFLCYLAKF